MAFRRSQKEGRNHLLKCPQQQMALDILFATLNLFFISFPSQLGRAYKREGMRTINNHVETLTQGKRFSRDACPLLYLHFKNELQKAYLCPTSHNAKGF